jgi:5-methylcytosine-specific restriction endonuclease McrA
MIRKSHLNDQVLVLNSNWQAVGTASVRKIVKKMFTCKGEIIDCYVHPDEVERCRRAGADPEFTYDLLDLKTWLQKEPREYEDYIVAARKIIVVPVVVRFHSYDDMPRMEVTFSRTRILIRDKCCCQYCGVRVARQTYDDKIRKTTEFTLDHVVPKSRGGSGGWLNIVTCCHRCNNRKADRTPEEAGMRLIRQPFKPKPGVAFIRNTPNKPWQWDFFLGKGVQAEEAA